jgi:hypothetical protein
MHTGLVRRVLSFSWQRWFVLALVLLAISLSVQYAIKTGHSKTNRSAILR